LSIYAKNYIFVGELQMYLTEAENQPAQAYVISF